MPYADYGLNATLKDCSVMVVEDIDLAKLLNPRPSSTLLFVLVVIA
ncbi:MAG: hypothetical protein IPL12_12205 [Bacteroidetes bacterium]|nr:hypothetical protein [Bacteroidota bacterium]